MRDVLQSHTVVTAAQEIAAIVLATALLGRLRLGFLGTRPLHTFLASFTAASASRSVR